jgi:hypothetical protein
MVTANAGEVTFRTRAADKNATVAAGGALTPTGGWLYCVVPMDRADGARTRRGTVLGAVFIMVLALAGTAHADHASEMKAREDFAAGRYDQALELFAKLYAETLNPIYLRNIGRCHQKLRDPNKAIDAFHDYLAKGKKISADEKAEINGYIKEMEALRDEQAKQAAPPPPPPPVVTPAPPQIQPIPPGPTPEMPANAGVYSGPPPAPYPNAPPSAYPTAPNGALVAQPGPPPEESPPLYTRWWFWTIIGAAVAGGVVAAVVLSSGGTTKPPCPVGVLGCK